jgi:hypothetical protein
MRQQGLILLGLWACCLAGCLTGQPAQSTSWLARSPFQGPSGPDVVLLEIAQIEASAADRFLNEELWTLVDDQVIPLERKALLEENGFRIAQIGGVTPPALQTLLTSERTCIDPRRIQEHAGMPTRIVLGTPLPACRFQLHRDDGTVEVSLKDAECAVIVVPTLTPDGRTRLHFTPEVQHGQAALWPQPTPDRSGWMFQKQRPTESYADLGWDVTLAPNEYVLVGARSDRPGTLAHECLIRADAAGARQRLLVIRTTRSIAGIAAESPSALSGDDPSCGSPPLALRAAVTTPSTSHR